MIYCLLDLVLRTNDDDDDDEGGGVMSPVYQRNLMNHLFFTLIIAAYLATDLSAFSMHKKFY